MGSRVRIVGGIAIGVLIISTSSTVYAQDFSSTNYSVLAPVIQPGGYATSSSFGLQSILTQLSTGTSSATSFGENIGFLYFPLVSTPAVSTSAGNAQVALTWTASTAFLGWTSSGYSVGQATASGGPYSFSSVGNVTSSTRTGLTNGTTYYFVIRVLDGFGNTIATSTQVSATPAAPGGGGSSGGGGGGGSSAGGGGAPASGPRIDLSGRAFPLSKIVIMKDGQFAASTIAGPDAKFSVSLNDLAVGNYNIGVYGEDKDRRISSTFTFPVGVTAGTVLGISGIFIAPTIATDKSEVRKGDNIAIFGQSAKDAEVTIQVNSENEIFVKAQADAQGVYLYTLDSSPLEIGNHRAKSKGAVASEISSFGSAVAFKVGTQNVIAIAKACSLKGDVNNDCKVNLVDFSIVAYWYKRLNPPKNVDINGDKKVDLIDFSIMAYNWTG